MKNPLIGDVRFYQRSIFPGLPAHCRYYPTCLQYMIDAIYTHEGVKGIMTGVTRILRCHPSVKGGIDYVPLKFHLTKNPDETCHGPHTYRRNKKTEVEKDGQVWQLWHLILAALL